MKGILRLALLLASIPIAYFAAMYAESFTGAPLGDGHMEGTPATEVAFSTIFPLTLIGVLVFGNMLISRYFGSRNLK
jgi:hypothetical protein